MVILFLGLALSLLWRIEMGNTASTKDIEKKPNRLIHEKSPYLLQHAYNPVDWFPWGDEAFKKAERENKPIFLSIGYSTCHWCHVMEHESFEDPEVAALMNEAFVSIKVDREERPDLDHVYMTVSQMMTGAGGWPLTILMTPDKKSFFAATYIPKESRFGRLGMMELIPRIQTVWTTRQNEVLDSAENILKALKETEKSSQGGDLDTTVLDQAYRDLTAGFDKEFGGFGTAPKFPTPHNFLFLLRYWKRSGDKMAIEVVEKTLEAMRSGGIFDHVGFGFHRYSTDREWLVPHFEKMLYDQAMLALAYLEAYQATGKGIFGSTAREIFTYILRTMTSPEGGFYSAEDADSEGVEGKFYVWTEEEIRRHFEKVEADFIIRLFNIEKDGNFSDEATGKKTDANILHLRKQYAELAADLKISAEALEERIAKARAQLFKIRDKRVHPYRDDKILTDWNGLMIAALARGSRLLDEPAYVQAAKRGADFVLKQLRGPDGRLLHRYREREAKITAHLDDYVFFVWGLIELYEATFEAQFLKTALELNETMLKHYWDEKAGGFFFTPDDGEKLIVRRKEIYGGPIPSGNAMALFNLLRLARFTGRTDLEKKASMIDNAFSDQIIQSPTGFTQFLSALDFGIGPSYEVVIVGSTGAEDTADMIHALNNKFIPNKVVLFRASDQESPEIDTLSPFIKNQVSIDGKATAYVCLNHACLKPTTSIKEMLDMLE
jgi:uncharacterized protein YyaL (SSP411 family)